MWMVELIGTSSDLADFAISLTGSCCKVTHDTQGYLLTSDSFATSGDAEDVRKKAEEMLSNVKLALTPGASYFSTASYFPSNYIHLKKILIDQLELINAQD